MKIKTPRKFILILTLFFLIAGVIYFLSFFNTIRFPNKVIVQSPYISKVVIKDYNWENNITTRYLVDRKHIFISDNTKKPYTEKISLTPKQSQEIDKILANITKVYQGDFVDPNIFDGVMITFTFTLGSKQVVTTFLNNVKIKSYAELTKKISALTQKEIQYHQENFKVLR